MMVSSHVVSFLLNYVSRHGWRFQEMCVVHSLVKKEREIERKKNSIRKETSKKSFSHASIFY